MERPSASQELQHDETSWKNEPGMILKALPSTFSYYSLLSNYKKRIEFEDLKVNKFKAITNMGRKISAYLIDTEKNLKTTSVDIQDNNHIIIRNSTKKSYDSMSMIIPEVIWIKFCGCASGLSIDLLKPYWSTSDSKNLLPMTTEGGIYSLNMKLEPALKTMNALDVANVVSAVIFGPDLVGIRNSIDQTNGCFIIKPDGRYISAK